VITETELNRKLSKGKKARSGVHEAVLSLYWQ